jgi:hypothetical protein
MPLLDCHRIQHAKAAAEHVHEHRIINPAAKDGTNCVMFRASLSEAIMQAARTDSTSPNVAKVENRRNVLIMVF